MDHEDINKEETQKLKDHQKNLILKIKALDLK